MLYRLPMYGVGDLLVNVEIVCCWEDCGMGEVCLEFPVNFHGKVA
jgi:hypothetical protein